MLKKMFQRKLQLITAVRIFNRENEGTDMRMLNVNEKFDTEQSEFNENKVIWKKVKGEGKKCEKI